MKTLKFSVDADGIALIAIDVPERSMNVLTDDFLADLSQAIEKVVGDAQIKGAILTSAKPGAFIAGADIKDMVNSYDKGISAEQAAEVSQALSRRFRLMETCGKPFACAMNGLALGGGFELALACHYRVLDEKASVGLPEVTIGLLPGAGGTQRVPRLIGIEKAAPLLLAGQHVKAAEALKLGLVHAVAKSEDVVAAARAWLLGSPSAVQPWDVKGYKVPGGAGSLMPGAFLSFTAGTTMVAQSTQRNYPAPLAILSCLFEGTQVPIDVGLRIESKYFATLLTGPVARNMMRTMFINKGSADKLVRRPSIIPKSRVSKVGVLGSGMMGAGIAYVSAAAGIDVVLLDSTIEKAEKGKQYSVKLQQKSIERGKTTQQAADTLLARIHPTVDYTDLAGCDLVVEAVFENRAVKADVTAKAAAVISKTALFASNTSTLPITGLSKAFSRPSDFIGLHFFSPVDKMPLVEVILGKETGSEAVAKALDYVGQLRKTPIVVNDSPGFFTSRVFSTFNQEGAFMLDEGVKPALIENAARQAGFAVGPLAISDEVTLELQLQVAEQGLADGRPETPDVTRMLKVLRKMVRELGRIGRRSGAGYYDYPADAKKSLWPGLAQHFPVRTEQPAVEEVKKRLLYIQALEAARCLEEGVIDHPADADVGSILGIGFPAWTGGTLSFIDTVGLQAFVDECERMAGLYGERFQPSSWLKDRAKKNARFYSMPLAAA